MLRKYLSHRNLLLHQRAFSTPTKRLCYRGEFTLVDDTNINAATEPLKRLIAEARLLNNNNPNQDNTGIIGVDTETCCSRPTTKGQQHKTSLLQLSTRSNCVMYRLNKLEDQLPSDLLHLLQDSSLLKCGIGLIEDMTTLIYESNQMHEIKIDDWNSPRISKLWLYNLHYFDDLNAYDSISRSVWHNSLINRWIDENLPFKGNGWEPYPSSLRIVNWIKWSLNGNLLKEHWINSLEIQVRMLSVNMEKHLLGNHLFANAKALIFAGLFFEGFEAKRWLFKGIKILKKELDKQILSDGAHFELSPMYHSIILEDLLDTINVLHFYKVKFPGSINLEIIPFKRNAEKMLSWLESMTHPDGDISFFNDSAFEIASSLDKLLAYSENLNLTHQKNKCIQSCWQKESGYIRLENNNAVALLDVGKIGPDYMPGHAHADTLSFEFSVFGFRTLVNSGTSCYGLSDERLRQRGTYAHNTVTIERENSSQVWSGFRVARRAKVFNSKDSEQRGKITLSACHNGYHRLYGKPTHCRKWQFSDRLLIIEDRVTGKGGHEIDVVFPLHPEIEIKSIDEGNVILSVLGKQIKVDFNGDGFYSPEDGDYPFYDLSSDVECNRSRDREPKLFGDQTMWFIFNDKGNVQNETEGDAIGPEVSGASNVATLSHE